MMQPFIIRLNMAKDFDSNVISRKKRTYFRPALHSSSLTNSQRDKMSVRDSGKIVNRALVKRMTGVRILVCTII
jgi:hypothetical protein